MLSWDDSIHLLNYSYISHIQTKDQNEHNMESITRLNRTTAWRKWKIKWLNTEIWLNNTEKIENLTYLLDPKYTKTTCHKLGSVTCHATDIEIFNDVYPKK